MRREAVPGRRSAKRAKGSAFIRRRPSGVTMRSLYSAPSCACARPCQTPLFSIGSSQVSPQPLKSPVTATPYASGAQTVKRQFPSSSGHAPKERHAICMVPWLNKYLSSEEIMDISFLSFLPAAGTPPAPSP